jgi:hypothetical protein
MRKKLTASAAAVALASFAPAAVAQNSGDPSAVRPPRSTDPVFRQFDFWLGEWDVYDGAGELAGTNSIRSEEYGCLLTEHWVNTARQTGQSYNFVDLETGNWRQMWVSAGATIDYQGGRNAKGEMVLEGTIGYGVGVAGNGARFRGTWTANADGTVTQHFQQYDDAKAVWNDWFTGIYKRRPPASK